MAKIQIRRSKIGREEARQIQLAQTCHKHIFQNNQTQLGTCTHISGIIQRQEESKLRLMAAC